jgi:hypothetical protein
MNSLLLTLLVVLSLFAQASATLLRSHEAPATVVSAMLTEPYLAALLSLVLLIATLI